MTTTKEPNPPSRKEEDFPKTTTIPEGWIMDDLMEAYNGERGVTILNQAPVPTTGIAPGKTYPVETDPAPETTTQENESLFSHRLEPFPSAWDLSGMWL